LQRPVETNVKEATMMMLVDCETCPVRHLQCADCVVTALGLPAVEVTELRRTELPLDGAELPLDRAERRAVSVLFAAGLVGAETAQAARAVRERGAIQSPARTGRRAG
jgi:hypothetical protein